MFPPCAGRMSLSREAACVLFFKSVQRVALWPLVLSACGMEVDVASAVC